MAIFTDSISEKFTPPGVVSHDGQTARIIYPGSKKPADGYPVLVSTSLSSFTTATEFVQFNQLMNVAQSRICYRWLLNGGAVVTAPLTVARGGATGNAISDASYDPASGLYGAAYVGNGVFIPPGMNPGSASVEPWRDPLRHMPEKDVYYIRHWLARRSESLGLDNGRVAYMGSSAAAVCGTFATHGVDQRSALGLSDVNESAMSWSAVVAMNLPSRLKTMGQATALGYMFTDKINTPNFDTPATFLTNSEPSYQDALSFLTFDSSRGAPLYLANNSPTYGASLTPPYSDDFIATDFHSLDFGAMIKLARPVHRFVAFSNTIATTGKEDAVYADSAADDNSLFVVDVVNNLLSLLDTDGTVMVNPSLADVAPQYNSTKHFAGAALLDGTWTKIIDAGPHKLVTIQNVTSGTAAILRVMTAGDLGVPTAQLGLYLGPPASLLLNNMTIHTAGEAIYAQSNASLNKADWQAIVYY